MLPGPQTEVCLTCHGAEARLSRLVRDGLLAPDARPTLLSSSLSHPFVHALDDDVYSSRDTDAATCTSCHSPHRSSPSAAERSLAGRRLSTVNDGRFEFELCNDCHGHVRDTDSPFELTRLLSPGSRSRHPVAAPASESSPSLLPEWKGKELSCTDCHGNSDPAGARGPHGSAVRHLLVAEYVTVDGSAESAGTYALCYSCHQREAVLDGTVFPLHRLHVVERAVACATCHSAHGAVHNRALIRFGEGGFTPGVGPSLLADRLAFDSPAPGSGACYLTCHGVDHPPAVYDTGAGLLDLEGAAAGVLRTGDPGPIAPPGALPPLPARPPVAPPKDRDSDPPPGR